MDKVVETIKASQVTHSRALEIAGEISAQEDVYSVKHKSKSQEKGNPRKSSTRTPSSNSRSKECLFFGSKHVLEKKLYPAIGQKCNNCGKVGHFAVKCHSSKV